MASVELATPRGLDEALRLRGEYADSALLLAGGQSLLILLTQGLVGADAIISLEHVAELRGVRERSSLELGATTTYREVAASPLVRQGAPLVATAASVVGSVHIRNRGTIGGSVCHADPAGDVPVALIASDATATLRTADGELRTLPVERIFTGNAFETVVTETEILTSVQIPRQPTSTWGYRRFSFREGEYPQCQAAVRLSWSPDGSCASARIAVGGAGPSPQRLRALEDALVGNDLEFDDVPGAVDAVAADFRPLADVRGSEEWKATVARDVIVSALEDAWRGQP